MHRLKSSRTLAAVLTVLAASLFLCSSAPAKEEESYAHRREHALALDEKNDPGAEPLLKKLLDENPKDEFVLIKYAYCLFNRAAVMPEGRKQKALLKECRSYFVRAKKLNPNQPVVEMMLNGITEDGKLIKSQFSSSEESDKLIKLAEKAYAAHDFANARDFYQQALQLEPTNYSATLFIGDAYFAEGKYEASLEWFTKAGTLNPSIETSFRYKADALAKLGRTAEALDQYIEAVVANPYTKISWHNLLGFTQRQGYAVRYRANPLPIADVQADGKNIKLGVGENVGPLTMAYAIFRAGWITEHEAEFKLSKQKYRQTLAEEKKCLEQLCADFFATKGPPPDSDREYALFGTAFKELQQIIDAELLEPHILFLRANQDIAQDYAAFQSAHREKLRRYLKQFYLSQP